MEFADLHIHSTYSDGKLNPKEIISYSKKIGLKAISITDHDNIDGSREVIEKWSNLGVEIIPGVEINTTYKNEEVHILGYFINLYDYDFSTFIKNIQNSRIIRAEKIIQKLERYDIKICMDELLTLTEGNSIGRPHFAKLLIDKGYARNNEDAFNKYLGKGKRAYIERYKLDPKEVIEKIKENRGFAVLAHPGLIKKQIIVKELTTIGIDGIEVYHSTHLNNQESKYYTYASKHNLLITGGSDCHSSNPNIKPFIGDSVVPYKYIMEMKNRIKLR